MMLITFVICIHLGFTGFFILLYTGFLRVDDFFFVIPTFLNKKNESSFTCKAKHRERR